MFPMRLSFYVFSCRSFRKPVFFELFALDQNVANEKQFVIYVSVFVSDFAASCSPGWKEGRI